VKPAAKTALVVLGLVVAAAPFWVALTIPFEKFEVPPSAATAAGKDVLADLASWDAATSDARRAAAQSVARRLPAFEFLRLEAFSCGGQTHQVAVFRQSTSLPEFVLVPGGTFEMGSDETSDYPNPRRIVTLARPFLIARTDCATDACRTIHPGELGDLLDQDLPAMVRWTEAKQFCDRCGLALPTEEQWERACRAGTTTTWSFGDAKNQLAGYAWYAANSSGPKQRVGKKQPNAFGLFDMHGNVWQWCADEAPGDVRGPQDRVLRSHVLRGGSCMEPAERTRSAERFWFTYGEHLVDDRAGFRPAKTVPAE
jgi:formylglycine-generating enzyme required for sulfatase activity